MTVVIYVVAIDLDRARFQCLLLADALPELVRHSDLLQGGIVPRCHPYKDLREGYLSFLGIQFGTFYIQKMNYVLNWAELQYRGGAAKMLKT